MGRVSEATATHACSSVDAVFPECPHGKRRRRGGRLRGLACTGSAGGCALARVGCGGLEKGEELRVVLGSASGVQQNRQAGQSGRRDPCKWPGHAPSPEQWEIAQSTLPLLHHRDEDTICCVRAGYIGTKMSIEVTQLREREDVAECSTLVYTHDGAPYIHTGHTPLPRIAATCTRTTQRYSLQEAGPCRRG